MYYNICKPLTLQLNMSEVGHQLEHMLADCEFQKVQCTPKNFTKWVCYIRTYVFKTNSINKMTQLKWKKR